MIKITEHHTGALVMVTQGPGSMVALDTSEQRELLEALARIQGFTLVDREERKSLLALTEEIDGDDNDYDLATTAWGAWQDRAEALAAAVNGLFDIRQEVTSHDHADQP